MCLTEKCSVVVRKLLRVVFSGIVRIFRFVFLLVVEDSMTIATPSYSITNDSLTLKIAPSFGARIIEFGISGRNALTESGPQTGSTFWPSPQSSWGWPPPPSIDSGTYICESSTDESLSLVSDPCRVTGIQVTKRFTVYKNGFRASYRM